MRKNKIKSNIIILLEAIAVMVMCQIAALIFFMLIYFNTNICTEVMDNKGTVSETVTDTVAVQKDTNVRIVIEEGDRVPDISYPFDYRGIVFDVANGATFKDCKEVVAAVDMLPGYIVDALSNKGCKIVVSGDYLNLNNVLTGAYIEDQDLVIPAVYMMDENIIAIYPEGCDGFLAAFTHEVAHCLFDEDILVALKNDGFGAYNAELESFDFHDISDVSKDYAKEFPVYEGIAQLFYEYVFYPEDFMEAAPYTYGVYVDVIG